MADNFNLRQFLTENKLTKNAKLLSEEKQQEAYQPKSKLEQIIQDAWAEKDLNKAKQMVIDLLEPSKVKSKDQIIQTLKGIQNKTRFDQYLANSLLKFEKLGLSEESEAGLKEGSDYGFQDVMDAIENDYEPGTPDYDKMVDAVNLAFHNNKVDTSDFSTDDSAPSREMRKIAKSIGLDKGTDYDPGKKESEKETVKESTLSPRERYLTRLVENALGIETTDEPKKPVPPEEGYGTRGVYAKLAKRKLPPVEGPKYSEGISEDEMTQETVIPEYKSIEELMKNIQDGTNKVAEEHKISEMKKIADALRKKKNTLEESEHAQYMNKADLKRLDRDIRDIEKAVAKAVATFDKKFNKKQKTSAVKAEKVEALQENMDPGAIEYRGYIIEPSTSNYYNDKNSAFEYYDPDDLDTPKGFGPTIEFCKEEIDAIIDHRDHKKQIQITSAFDKAGITGMVTLLFQSDSSMGEPDIDTMPAERALESIIDKAANTKSVIVVQGDKIVKGEQIGDYEDETQGLTCKLIVEILDKGVYEIWQ